MKGGAKIATERLKSIFNRRRTPSLHPLISEKEQISSVSLPRPPTPRQPNVLKRPQLSKAAAAPAKVGAAATSASTLTINLENQTKSDNVFAYVTGSAIDKNNALFLLRADGTTPYYPGSPGAPMQALGEDCAIKLGAPGSTKTIQIPHIAGGRIWFSTDKPMTFLLNPGPALVEPSVANEQDANSQLNWSFAELTWNNEQLYANISYVDFVGMPVALTLDTVSNSKLHVSGMKPEGLQQIADGLKAQKAKDGQGWDQLIVNQPGSNDKVLRILSPGQGMNKNNKLFERYYDDYVNQVYGRFSSMAMSLDTQMKSGVVTGKVVDNTFDFQGSKFTRPSTGDIFSCDTGPFKTGNDAQTNAIIPRLSAAFNRSTLLSATSFPTPAEDSYKTGVTNHYSRLVHGANLDGRGYAFPYDDVQPTNGKDQSGAVHAGDPKALTVTIGGGNAHV